MRYVIAITLVLILSPVCFGASFNCQEATGRIEKSICLNKELSTLDEHMFVAYSRALAMSNNPSSLKDTQKRWLRDRRNKCAEVSCMISSYKERLQNLEQISGSFDSMPDSKLVHSLCRQLAAPETRKTILQNHNDARDINNDGRPEVAKHCWGGTMNTPCQEYVNGEGLPLAITQIGFEWKDYWTYGLERFSYLGRTYFLHSSDDSMNELSHLTYITPKNEEHVLCEFVAVVKPVVEKRSNDAGEICEEATRNSAQIQPIELPEEIEDYPDTLHREATRILNMGSIDINNDGTSEKIVELLFASGGGRGCDFNYYEVLNDEGTALAGSLTRDHFLAIQGVDAQSGYWERSCGGISNRLFMYRNKVYYEHNVGNNEVDTHTISQLQGNNTSMICKYGRKIETTVRGSLLYSR